MVEEVHLGSVLDEDEREGPAAGRSRSALAAFASNGARGLATAPVQLSRSKAGSCFRPND
jgi:hypothetical protein